MNDKLPALFPVMTICGSMKFYDMMLEEAEGWTRQGYIVLMPFVKFSSDEQLNDPMKNLLDEMHRRKIDMADVIFIVNPEGYIGNSTASEIEYARATGKRIMSMETIL